MIGEMKKEIEDNYDKMFVMETKYMSFSDLREYRQMARVCQGNRIKISLILLLCVTLLYALSFTVCFLYGINFWMFASVFMLFIGAAGTMLIYAIMYDKARRTRDEMDNRYANMELK